LIHTIFKYGGNKEIVYYCIVLYCIVLYCIVLYCIDNDNSYLLHAIEVFYLYIGWYIMWQYSTLYRRGSWWWFY